MLTKKIHGNSAVSSERIRGKYKGLGDWPGQYMDDVSSSVLEKCMDNNKDLMSRFGYTQLMQAALKKVKHEEATDSAT